MRALLELIRQAVGSGLEVRAGIQCAFGCVYEGAVAEDRVIEMAVRLAETGANELNLADTTGMANPLQVRRLVAKTRAADTAPPDFDPPARHARPRPRQHAGRL